MLILASGSPRRQELLKLVTADYKIISPDVDESQISGLSPEDTVEALALLKAEAVFESHPKDTVLGADTIVELDGQILGKPHSHSEAVDMLTALSGRSHRVLTGVALLKGSTKTVTHVATEVVFEKMTAKEIEDYVNTGEPMDKAGAYGIQGYASKFVKSVNGDYFNIVGLPVNKVYNMLKN